MQILWKAAGRHRLNVSWNPRSWPRLRDVIHFHPATWIMHGILAVAFMVALSSTIRSSPTAN